MFKWNECIITEKFICPHDELTGKLCFFCKIPDLEREKLKIKGIIERKKLETKEIV